MARPQHNIGDVDLWLAPHIGSAATGVVCHECRQSASEMLIITSPITTIRKIVLPPFGGIEGGLSAPGSAIAARSEGTKTEAKLRLIARGERSVTPGLPDTRREASARCENACLSSDFASFSPCRSHIISRRSIRFIR